MEFWRYFRRPVVLFRAWGVPVRADLSWFAVVAIFSAAASASVVDQVGTIGGGVMVGLTWTLLFFASIFLHEFAHAAAAKLERLEVVEIVLHPFGGLTRFRHEPETPRAEFRIALAGPAASFILTLIFFGLMAAANAANLDILAVLLFLLALSNFLLAVFNMFPGYPLDGGRVLRAYLWRSGRDLNESTILTGRAGQMIAAVLIAIGLLLALLYSEYFTGFWAIIVGFFLFDSARGIITEVKAAKEKVVEDVMILPIPVAPDSDLQTFVDSILPAHKRAVFAVGSDHKLHGMLLLTDMKAIDRSQWRNKLIREVMRPVEPGHFVHTGTPLNDAREQMHRNGIGAIGVLDNNGDLVGFLLSKRAGRS
jgi:Zn-dependent protease